MPDFSSAYRASDSEYLKASDIRNPIPARIVTAELTTFQSGDSRVVVTLITNEGEKKLSLNKTNFSNLVSFFGADSDGWVGKAILVTTHIVQFNGRNTPGILVQNHPQYLKIDPLREIPF